MVPCSQCGLLLCRAYMEREVLSGEHTVQGTLSKARVGPQPASVLRSYPQPWPGREGRRTGRSSRPVRPDRLPVQLRVVYGGGMGSL
ncbi:hypothetical protein GCM10010293_54020 [Streptomyces griseoflavus]|nr:hypothetical protein GCM10010293_54020 [Streptomyces griseoflavus]